MRLVAAFLALTLPFPAMALSCLPYNAISSFKEAAKSDDDYVAVLGELSFNPARLPKRHGARQQKAGSAHVLTGRVVGKSLTRNGFTTPFERKIDINVQCVGPWCGRLIQGRNLVFLKRKHGTYLLDANLCGGFAFAQPSEAMLDRIKTCTSGGPCKTGLPN